MGTSDTPRVYQSLTREKVEAAVWWFPAAPEIHNVPCTTYSISHCSDRSHPDSGGWGINPTSTSQTAPVLKNPSPNAGDTRHVSLIPELGESPRAGNGNPLQVFLPRKSYRQRKLVGYCPWGHKELDTRLSYIHTHTHTSMESESEFIVIFNWPRGTMWENTAVLYLLV